MTRSKQFRAFERLLGVDRFQNLVFVLNKWLENPSDRDVQLELNKERELKDRYWDKMVDRGAMVMRHDGRSESAKLIIMSLMYKPKAKLTMPYEEFQEKLKALYNEVPNRDTVLNTVDKEADSEIASNFLHVRRSLILKVAWTATRLIPVALFTIIAGVFVTEQKSAMFAFTADNFAGFVVVSASVAGLLGLFYRWPILSASVFVMDTGLVVYVVVSLQHLTAGTFDRRSLWFPFLLAISPPMTYFYWLYRPHTSHMYFF